MQEVEEINNNHKKNLVYVLAKGVEPEPEAERERERV